MHQSSDSPSHSPRFVHCNAQDDYLLYVGLRVVEVAHDIQQQVSKYVTGVLGMVNSYDTWHGVCLHVILKQTDLCIMIFPKEPRMWARR